MTQLILKNDIQPHQMNVLLQLLQSWNIEAEYQSSGTPAKVVAEPAASCTFDPLSEIRGMWADYDIDAKELRRKAWRYDRRAKNYDTL